MAALVADATGKHVADYLSEKLWMPTGMEAHANWWLDSADGLEIGVVACLNAMPGSTSSYLAVIALDGETPRLLSHLPIELIPEGIKFSADGRHLFVGSTMASHISVFEVHGRTLRRSPFVLPTGFGLAAQGIATQ